MKHLKIFEDFEESEFKYKVGDEVYYEDISDDKRSGPYDVTKAYKSKDGRNWYDIKSGKNIGEGIGEEELSEW